MAAPPCRGADLAWAGSEALQEAAVTSPAASADLPWHSSPRQGCCLHACILCSPGTYSPLLHQLVSVIIPCPHYPLSMSICALHTGPRGIYLAWGTQPSSARGLPCYMTMGVLCRCIILMHVMFNDTRDAAFHVPSSWYNGEGLFTCCFRLRFRWAQVLMCSLQIS